MDPDALRSYVDRSRELVASAPELSERNTQIRLVQPFLTALGWELHQIAADYPVETESGGTTVDFALLLDGEPAVLVETGACADDLDRDRAARLGRTLLDSGVDRGVLTNGRGFAFVAVSDGSLERFECRLEALGDHADVLSEYSRRAALRRRRGDAAAALADARDEVVDDVTARLVETAGDAVADELRAETGRFVDDLIASFRDADEPRETAPPETSDSDAAASADETPPSGQADDEATDTSREATDVDEEAADTAAVQPDEYDVPADALGGAVADDGQYVVRFFGRRTSVWAVGHARAAMTAAQAIEYLRRRGDETVTPPWGPDDEHTVLREDPIANATIELPDGVYLDARVPVDVARAAIETLADDAGLRAMFQGEWD